MRRPTVPGGACGDRSHGPRRGQQLGGGRVRPGLPVGEAPAPVHGCPGSLGEGRKQPSLPRPGFREDECGGRPAVVADSPPLLVERGELAVPADEGGVRVTPRRRLLEPDRLPDFDRLRLSARGRRLDGGVLDGMARRAMRPRADQDRARRRCRLDSRRRVHHVAHRERLAGRRLLGADERLSGRDADPDLEGEPGVGGVQVGDCRPHGEGGAQRALRIVLVADRGSEERDHGVADELLDRAAEPLELVPQAAVVRQQSRADVLGIELLGAGGRADEVDEDGRDEPALPRADGDVGPLEGQPAGEAETGARRVILGAPRAARHRSSAAPRLRGHVLAPARWTGAPAASSGSAPRSRRTGTRSCRPRRTPGRG